LRITHQIDRYVHLQSAQELCHFTISFGSDVVELIERGDETRAYVTAIVAAKANPEHLETAPIVALQELRDQLGYRMPPKIS
jgi:hypothetical protein